MFSATVGKMMLSWETGAIWRPISFSNGARGLGGGAVDEGFESAVIAGRV
jgi:hypothetical protein